MTARLYGCHNQPRPTADTVHPAQDGYELAVSQGWGWYSREPRWRQIQHVMSTDCRYDASARDQGCAGCVHAPHLHQGAAAC